MTKRESIEQDCYILCETGRFAEANAHLSLATPGILTAQEAADLRDDLIEDYQEFRELQ